MNDNKLKNAAFWNVLSEISQVEVLVELSFETPVLIFKHSYSCGISLHVLDDFEHSFNDSDIALKPFILDLLRYRPISNFIAERFKVVHQSPQIILLKNGVVVHQASHQSIQFNDLKKYIH